MSEPKNDGGPAFPRPASHDGEIGEQGCSGMSLRDWFAGQALANFKMNNIDQNGIRWLVEHAYIAADAMLLQREK